MNAHSTIPALNDFRTLLDGQAELLDSLLALGHEQADAIRAGRMNELLRLLSRKQPMMDDLLDHVRRLKPLADRFRNHAADEGVLLDECRRLHLEASERFQAMLELEQECERLLADGRDRIGERLRETVHGITVAQAYGDASSSPPQASRLDLSSGG